MRGWHRRIGASVYIGGSALGGASRGHKREIASRLDLSACLPLPAPASHRIMRPAAARRLSACLAVAALSAGVALAASRNETSDSPSERHTALAGPFTSVVSRARPRRALSQIVLTTSQARATSWPPLGSELDRSINLWAPPRARVSFPTQVETAFVIAFILVFDFFVGAQCGRGRSSRKCD